MRRHRCRASRSLPKLAHRGHLPHNSVRTLRRLGTEVLQRLMGTSDLLESSREDVFEGEDLAELQSGLGREKVILPCIHSVVDSHDLAPHSDSEIKIPSSLVRGAEQRGRCECVGVCEAQRCCEEPGRPFQIRRRHRVLGRRVEQNAEAAQRHRETRVLDAPGGLDKGHGPLETALGVILVPERHVDDCELCEHAAQSGGLLRMPL
mmetsp:Transcript_28642/g.65998  ORF Transcript_28642/g.65998 Transcript_28642/m.65998 type:complete len:206 (-) Transcript_28642:2621-3238(-)